MSKGLILAIDDDASIRVLLTAGLEKAGYDVKTAPDGATGILAAQRSKPDLIILDIGLPGGDGLLVLGRLRRLAAFERTPIVVLTGKEGPEWRTRALETGASSFLTKPIDGRELLSEIRRQLSTDDEPDTGLQCEACGHEISLAQLDPQELRELAERIEASKAPR